MKNLKSMSTDEILKSYEFPHKFYVYYASQIAKNAMEKYVKSKDRDERSLKAIDIAERFGNGEDISQKVLEDTVSSSCTAAHAAHYGNAANSAAHVAAANAAYAAANAAHAAANAANAAPHYAAASAAAHYAAAHYADNARKEAETYNKELLLSLIETRLTKLEKLLILGEGKE